MIRLLVISALRYFRAHRLQLCMSVVGIAVGVAMVTGVDLATNTASRAFAISSETVSGTAIHQLTGPDGKLPTSVYRRLRVEFGVRQAAPVVEGFGRTSAGTVRILGIDPFAAGGRGRELPGFPMPTLLMGQPDGVVLSVDAADRLNVKQDSLLTIRVSGRDFRLRVLGLVRPPDRVSQQGWSDLLVTDIALAQELLGMPGEISRIDLFPGAGDPNRLAGLLGSGLRASVPEARQSGLAQMTSAFETNLQALSYLALVVGMFLIFNVMSFSVVQRRAVYSRLRATGVSRRAITLSVLGEAALLGVVGSAAGCLIGVGLADGLLSLVSRAINDLYFVLNVETVRPEGSALMKAGGMGLLASLISAWIPARRAANSSAVAALRRSEDEADFHRHVRGRAWIGLWVGGLGLVLMLMPTGVAGAYAGLFGAIAAFALIAPLGIRTVLSGVAQLPMSLTLRMAVGGVRTQLSRMSVAAIALSVSVAAVIGVGVMVSSFRTTVEDWLGSTLLADVYVQVPGTIARIGGPVLDDDVAMSLASMDGVEAALGIRRVEVASQVGTIMLTAIEHSRETRDSFQILSATGQDPWSSFEAGDIFVSEPFAFRKRLGAGDSLTIETTSGSYRAEIGAVYVDYASDVGVVMLDRKVYRRLFGDSRLNGLALFARPGVNPDSLAATVRAETRQALLARSNASLREASLEVFDRTFAITGVLQLLALLVAVVGVISAISAIQLERTWEFAVQRAIGLRKSVLRRVLVFQSAVMGLLAGLLAIPLGLALAAGLVFVINKRSFGWTLNFELDVLILVQAVLVSVVAAMAAGGIPAFHAGSRSLSNRLKSVQGIAPVLLVGWLVGCGPEVVSPGMGLSEALRVDTTGFMRADAAYRMSFPADHGAHDRFYLEWWYFTGNVVDQEGRDHGYQFTIFRTALAPGPVRLARGPGTGERRLRLEAPDGESEWRASQLYTAHLATTNPGAQRFRNEERQARGAAGLAGGVVDSGGVRVWVEDWQAVAAPDLSSVRLTAMGLGLGIDLLLQPEKPIVLQGDQGFSPKGRQDGQASHYYSSTRMRTSGRMVSGVDTLAVSGLSWLDREWSTTLLSEDQSGWDWFSIQLDDGRDLMFFRLRSRVEDYKDGAIVDIDGGLSRIDAQAARLRPLRWWESGMSGVSYPVAWELTIPDLGLNLRIEAAFDGQELDTVVRYWEGMIRVSGSGASGPVSGRGYMELTGYEKAAP